ncbi:helix-turn-helix domain-containing protein [Rhabdaerophilum calidifontis]|uniref:helix-turn-helix domain-containing protein n=1 Tax=Rhabdaerophilum calidifontis TaxID=2604328 RepID=UPI00123AC88C|nr:helix-turn-helix domain-containing protein [Rhabdaerophilum calidifontis]
MRDRKLFVGAGIRRLRESRAMTQADLATQLRISTAYLSQMETNQRPVSAAVLYGLGQLFGAEAGQLVSEDPDRLAADLREALADPVFSRQEASHVDIRALALSAPWLAHRFLELHAAFRRALDAGPVPNPAIPFDAAPGETPRDVSAHPFDVVRDFFHYNDNYIDDLDLAAERLAARAFDGRGRDLAPFVDFLQTRHGVRVRDLQDDDPRIRIFDAKSRVLSLNPALEPTTRGFHLAAQIARLEHGGAIDAAANHATLRTPEARALAQAALTNYFAAALVMPYGLFAAEAKRTRHDLVRLGHRFGASFEQVCHRLSTLQRNGARGVPVYFVKLDRAGNIVKRHSATRFQFARFGGACPLWNVHEAFETPDRILVQQAEMPDGMRYLCLAKSVVKPPRFHGGPGQRYAIGLGCAISDAQHFVYSDRIDMRGRTGVARVGINCRLCARIDCAQRSAPPLSRRITLDPDARATLPYDIL